jgi:hypothetical protein
MKNNIVRKLTWYAAAGFAGVSLLSGCDRTVSHTEDVKVRNDGSVKAKETTVTEHSDGTVSKTETKTDSKP